MFELALACYTGPLDLLRTAVESGQLPITGVALVEVTGQYLAYLRGQEELDPAALAEFVAIAARLMELKSRALLPRPPEPEPAAEDPADTAEDLALLLREYRLYRVAADELREREHDGLRSFPRLAPLPPLPPGPGLSDVTLDRLLTLVRDALNRRPPDPPAVTPVVTVTIRERLATLEGALAGAGRVSFAAFIGEAWSRLGVVVSFLAVLELIKRGRVAAEQAEAFGDIVIVALAPVPAGAA